MNAIVSGRSRGDQTGREGRKTMSIVVISRQVGSLGDEIAASVAKRLNYDLADQAKVRQLAQGCDAEFSKACSLYETEQKPSFFESFFFQSAAYTSLFESLNYQLASQDHIVIIGRGAQIVLRDIPDVFTARVVAPTDIRVGRVMERTKMGREEARSFIEKYDKQRRDLINSIFERDLRDWSLYDVILNTACYEVESGAEVLCKAIEVMKRPTKEKDLQERLRNLAFAKRVESRIKKNVATTPYRDIQVRAASDGTVTLTGLVSERRTKELAEKTASKVDGVRKVVNELKVTELSF
jgi:hypothetical protein